MSRAVQRWNALPWAVVSSSNLDVFRKKLTRSSKGFKHWKELYQVTFDTRSNCKRCQASKAFLEGLGSCLL